MRTKALLCAAGLLAAGVASSLAQSNVYSLNVVGYVNITLSTGFNLIANQLDVDGNGTNNTVQGTFGTNGIPNLARWYGYSPATGFGIATFFATTGTWSGGGGTANNAVNPGNGGWFFVPGASGVTVTTVGTVPQGSVGYPIVSGFQIVSFKDPISGRVKTDFGFPAGNLDRFYQFSPVTGYAIKTYFSGTGTWSPSEPNLAVGEAAWLQRGSAGATTWVQSFTVQ